MKYLPILLLVACSTPRTYEIAVLQYEEANEYFAKGDYISAIPLYEEALLQRDQIRDAHLKLAICYDRTDNPVGATSVLQDYLRLVAPRDYQAMRHLADLYVRANRRDEAIELYETVIQSAPLDAGELREKVRNLRSVSRS